MMKMLKTLLSLALMAAMFLEMAMAANYTVGGSNGGWDQSTDLQTWASSVTFLEGDNLIFQYTPNHDVTEVSKPDFDTCTASNPLQPPHTGGAAVIPLTAAGSRYFMCGTAAHCISGMKVEITTLAASAPPPPTTPAVSPPPPPTTPAASPPPPQTTPAASPPPPRTTPAASPPPPAASAPPPSTTPAVPSPPPKHFANHPASSPPSKTVAPSPPPSASAPPPSGSLLPPAPSSAARFDVMGGVTGLVLIMYFINV